MIRYYISEYTGTGTLIDPFRPALVDLVEDNDGMWYGFDNPVKQHSICRVSAIVSVHEAIISNNLGTAIGPLAKAINIYDVHNSAYNTSIESYGYSVAWSDISSTIKQVLRYIVRNAHIAQRAKGEKVQALIDLLVLNTDSLVTVLPVAKRNVIRNWMENKGMSTSWIDANTTVRQVLHYIQTNLNIGNLRLGNHTL